MTPQALLVAVHTYLLLTAAVTFAPAHSGRRRLGVTKSQTGFQEEERIVNSQSPEVSSSGVYGLNVTQTISSFSPFLKDEETEVTLASPGPAPVP